MTCSFIITTNETKKNHSRAQRQWKPTEPGDRGFYSPLDEHYTNARKTNPVKRQGLFNDYILIPRGGIIRDGEGTSRPDQQRQGQRFGDTLRFDNHRINVYLTVSGTDIDILPIRIRLKID